MRQLGITLLRPVPPWLSSLLAHRREGRGESTRGHCSGRAAQRRLRVPPSVSVCDAGGMYHGHLPPPARSGWPGGPEGGRKRHGTRGWLARHCSTAVAVWPVPCSTTTDRRRYWEGGERSARRARRARHRAWVVRAPRPCQRCPGVTASAPARECVACWPGVLTVTGVPVGIHSPPTFGNRGRSSASAQTRASQGWRCSHPQRRRAKRSVRQGWLSLASNVARFHPPSRAGSQWRTVSAETVTPCWACRGRASVAPLQRVRHRPEVCGTVSRSVSSACWRERVTPEGGGGGSRCPWAARRNGQGPA